MSLFANSGRHSISGPPFGHVAGSSSLFAIAVCVPEAYRVHPPGLLLPRAIRSAVPGLPVPLIFPHLEGASPGHIAGLSGFGFGIHIRASPAGRSIPPCCCASTAGALRVSGWSLTRLPEGRESQVAANTAAVRVPRGGRRRRLRSGKGVSGSAGRRGRGSRQSQSLSSQG